MVDWVETCVERLQADEPLVIVSIVSVQGSSPREPGARMLVTSERIWQTIGGGNLEYQTIAIARQMLQQTRTTQLQRFSLAAGLGQCCGGVVNVLFEKLTAPALWLDQLHQWLAAGIPVMQVIPLRGDSMMERLLVTADQVYPVYDASAHRAIIRHARQQLVSGQPSSVVTLATGDDEPQALLFDLVSQCDFNILLFGAGHVGQALAGLLAQQPCRLTWVDTRDGQLPLKTAEHIQTICSDTPQTVIEAAAPGSYFLVMTHDHQLDQQLAQQILKRNDFSYFGLIGSRSKRARFEHRLAARGIAHEVLQKMVCPIGIGGIKSKLPGAIAISVMAELLIVYEQQASNKLLPAQTA